jgi:hypothetical protein
MAKHEEAKVVETATVETEQKDDLTPLERARQFSVQIGARNVPTGSAWNFAHRRAEAGDAILQKQREKVSPKHLMPELQRTFMERVVIGVKGGEGPSSFSSPEIAAQGRAMEVIGLIADMSPEEQTAAMQELFDAGTPEEANVAKAMLIHAITEQRRGAADNERGEAGAKDKHMAELQDRELARKKESDKKRELSQAERDELEELVFYENGGAGRSLTRAEQDRLKGYRERLSLSEDEQREKAVEQQDKVFSILETGLGGVLHGRGRVEQLQKEYNKNIWQNNIGFDLGGYVNHQREIWAKSEGLKGKVKALVEVVDNVGVAKTYLDTNHKWSGFIKVGLAYAKNVEWWDPSNKKELKRKAAVELIENAQEALRTDSKVEQKHEQEDRVANYLEGAVDSYTPASLRGSAWEEALIVEAGNAAQKRYGESSALILKYQEEYAEFFQEGVDLKTKTERDGAEIDDRIKGKDLNAYRAHQRYLAFQKAATQLSLPEGEKLKKSDKKHAEKILNDQVKALDAELESRKDDFKALKDQEKKKARYKRVADPSDEDIHKLMDAEFKAAREQKQRLEGALAKLGTGDSEAAFKLMTAEMAKLETENARYQDLYEQEKFEVTVDNAQTDQEKRKRMPQEYQDALAARDEALKMLEAMQEMQRDAGYDESRIKLGNDEQGVIVLKTLKKEIVHLRDTTRRETERAEAEGNAAVNRELNVALGNLLGELNNAEVADVDALLEQAYTLVQNSHAKVEEDLGATKTPEQKQIRILKKEKLDHMAKAGEYDRLAEVGAALEAQVRWEIAETYGEEFLHDAELQAEIMKREMEIYHKAERAARRLNRNETEENIKAAQRELYEKVKKSEREVEKIQNMDDKEIDDYTKKLLKEYDLPDEAYGPMNEEVKQIKKEGAGIARSILNVLMNTVEFKV